MNAEPERTYLAVPYESRDQVKSLGGRWDREERAWYVPPGRDSAPFSQWHRATAAPPSPDRDPRQQFADELRKAGFRIDGDHPVMDGRIHRASVDGDRGAERNGSYLGFTDGVPNGWHQNFKKTKKPIPWKADCPGLTDQERIALVAVAATNRRAAEKKRELAAEQASQKAVEILTMAMPATVGHAYLTSKQVRGEGLFIAAPGTSIETEKGREIDISGRLLVPVRDVNGTIMSLQIIDDAGRKMFLPGGKLGGGQHVVGNIDSPWPLHVAEGYATAATIHEATGHAVVVAFTAHNLGTVASQQREQRPNRSMFIAGDNDHHLPLQTDEQGKPKRNVGLAAALAAAAAVDGHALIPAFSAGDRGTDWNDAKMSRGIEAVRGELASGLAEGGRRKIAQDIERERGYGHPAERARAREIVR